VVGVRACMHMRHPQRVYRNRLAGELLARLRAAAEKTAGLVMRCCLWSLSAALA
jgi:hypothetical protein